MVSVPTSTVVDVGDGPNERSDGVADLLATALALRPLHVLLHAGVENTPVAACDLATVALQLRNVLPPRVVPAVAIVAATIPLRRVALHDGRLVVTAGLVGKRPWIAAVVHGLRSAWVADALHLLLRIAALVVLLLLDLLILLVVPVVVVLGGIPLLATRTPVQVVVDDPVATGFIPATVPHLRCGGTAEQETERDDEEQRETESHGTPPF